MWSYVYNVLAIYMNFRCVFIFDFDSQICFGEGNVKLTNNVCIMVDFDAIVRE